MADLEFVQFHPTVLWLGEGASGQQPLISEAVRGEGAFLVDGDGVRFMQGRAPAGRPRPARRRGPRDRRPDAAHRRATTSSSTPGTSGGEFLEQRFPSIVARCRELGFDPATDLLPVAPAQHYASGGVQHRPASAGPPSTASTPAARSPAPASTAPTGSPPTRCSRAWSSPTASPTTSPTRLAAGELPHGVAGARSAGPASLLDASQRADSAARDDARGGRRALRRVAGRDGTRRSSDAGRSPRAPAGRARARPSWETTNLLHLGQAADRWWPPCARRPAAATSAPTSPSATTTHWLRPHSTTPATRRRQRHDDRSTPCPLRTSHDRPPATADRPRTSPRRTRRPLVRTALDEDLGGPTASTSPRSATIPRRARPHRRTWWPGPTAWSPGCRWSPLVFDDVATAARAGRRSRSRPPSPDGDAVRARRRARHVCAAPTRALLVGERTMLNIALPALRASPRTPAAGPTPSRAPGRWCSTPARPRPGCAPWRSTPCAAGGGTNKRMGLYDVAMIKDNHKLAAGSLTAAYDAVRERVPRRRRPGRGDHRREALEAVAVGARFLSVRQHVGGPAARDGRTRCGPPASTSRSRRPAG